MSGVLHYVKNSDTILLWNLAGGIVCREQRSLVVHEHDRFIATIAGRDS